MEIVRRVNQGHKFKVMRSFLHGGKALEPGAEVEIEEPGATNLVYEKRVAPLNVAEVGEYIALADLTLPGAIESHKARRGDKILLRKDQAIDLMIQKLVLPVDSERWRPFNRRLASQGE